MKSASFAALRGILHLLRTYRLLGILVLSVPLAAEAADALKTFATPEEAVAALVAASGSEDFSALRALFGPASAEIENPDRVQATNELRAFNQALNQAKRLVAESDSRWILEVGPDLWPFPVPILQRGGRCYFDTEAGLDELLSRRIGRNELATLRLVRAYVDAQREYATRDRDGDLVLEFAQKFGSAPQMKDGLYWSPELDGEISPLGPLAAQAYALGYGKKSAEADDAPQPFHGYLFKVLTRQTKAAPGGRYDYVINGNMIGGFALVAWPAEYGVSGIMTFMVNQQGRVYQKDLGPKTAKTAAAIKAYDPDESWSLSRD